MGRDIHRSAFGCNRLKMSDAMRIASMLVVRTMPLVMMMLVVVVMFGTTVGTLARFRIVLQAKDFLMMVVRQY